MVAHIDAIAGEFWQPIWAKVLIVRAYLIINHLYFGKYANLQNQKAAEFRKKCESIFFSISELLTFPFVHEQETIDETAGDNCRPANKSSRPIH